jgi:triosephosphate isomerase (TIM)
MRKLIVANWKMNPASYKEADTLVQRVSKYAGKIKSVDVVLCPPFTWLTDLSHGATKGILWGAQDVFWEEKGAFTGEVSPVMLKNSNVKYVIIGHSERRKWLGETDEMVNKKVLAALKGGLRVILCVGEPLSVRKKGFSTAKKFVKNQLIKDLRGVRASLVIAYEPIWAISGGKYGHPTDDPKDSAEMARFIRSVVMGQLPRVVVIYGGSVNSKNAKSFLQYKEIDGALVGGASLDAKEFNKIINTVS